MPPVWRPGEQDRPAERPHPRHAGIRPLLGLAVCQQPLWHAVVRAVWCDDVRSCGVGAVGV